MMRLVNDLVNGLGLLDWLMVSLGLLDRASANDSIDDSLTKP